MTLVMAYVVLISACAGACAVVLEAVMRSRALGGRLAWLSALGVTLLVTAVAMFLPRNSGTAALVPDVSIAGTAAIAAPGKEPIRPSTATPGILVAGSDAVLPPAWMLATVILLMAIGVGQRRLRRERMKSSAAELLGHPVLLTESTGPAVAGIREPVVFVPRWVLAIDEPSQRLLVEHEMEHVRGRDTTVLFLGALTAAVLPWNPVVWWMVRRLRLAVEQDCDARVLARHPGVRRYADLLLLAASRHGLASRLLAAHFGEHTSDLMRRIEAMTSNGRLSRRSIAGGTLVASALIVVACETPRPEPVAPISISPASAPAPAVVPDSSARSSVEQVPNVIVLNSDGQELARYHGEIPVAHLPPDGVERINVMNDGICAPMSCPLIKITLKPDASLRKELRVDAAEAKRWRVLGTAIDTSHFHFEAEVRKTPLTKAASEAARGSGQFIEVRADSLRFESAKTFRGGRLAVSGMTLPAPASRAGGTAVPFDLVEQDANRVATGSGTVELPPRILLRGDTGPVDPPNVIVLSSGGAELRRIHAPDFRADGRKFFDQLKTEDIESIEVQKGSQCAPLTCPLLRVTLKAGREAAYKLK